MSLGINVRVPRKSKCHSISVLVLQEIVNYSEPHELYLVQHSIVQLATLSLPISSTCRRWRLIGLQCFPKCNDVVFAEANRLLSSLNEFKEEGASVVRQDRTCQRLAQVLLLGILRVLSFLHVLHSGV